MLLLLDQCTQCGCALWASVQSMVPVHKSHELPLQLWRILCPIARNDLKVKYLGEFIIVFKTHLVYEVENLPQLFLENKGMT
jgi:hypothetical protein